MARLNEPAPSLDSVEALKRRFIRQNREIARVNSTQSQRIRNLETEISRLLGENIQLREQAINTAQNAQRSRSTCSRCQKLNGLKGSIEGKLTEIQTLVNGLAPLDKDRQSISPGRRVSSIFRFPGQENVTYGGAVKPAKQPIEGFLPAIIEGKNYPRKTLDVDEVKAMALEDVASESPDLGPPPVAHFDVTEIAHFEPRASISQNNQSSSTSALTSNLESRRRRRASAFLDSNSNVYSNIGENSVTLRSAAGSKRKLSAREGDTSSQDIIDGYSAEFSSQRTRAGSRPSNTAEKDHTRSQLLDTVHRRLETSPRKALQPKDVNSPSKPKRAIVNGKVASYKDEIARQEDARQHKRDNRNLATMTPSLNNTNPQVLQRGLLADSTTVPPFTPAAADVFSPLSTEPSAARDNPLAPEMKSISSVEDVISQSTRPSRRPKGAVSYAEPSLRDKMRRPTKELAPAIVDVGRPQHRAPSARAEEECGTFDKEEVVSKAEAEKPKMRTVVVKKEHPSNDTSWKNLPPVLDGAVSPLIGKVHRNQSQDSEKAVTRDQHAPTRARAKEAKIAATNGPSTEKDSEGLEEGIDKLSIYDGPNSSPPSPSKSEGKPEESTSAPKRPIKSSRRHSTNPAGTCNQSAGYDFNSGHRPLSNRSSAITKRTEKEGHRLEASRPSSAFVHREKKELSNEGVKLGRSESVRGLVEKRAIDHGSQPGESVRGGERTMSRRRSMMI